MAIAGNLCAYFVLAVSALFHAEKAIAVTPDSYERGLNELRPYCLERICIGMSAYQLMSQGKLDWHAERQPTGQVSCSQYPGNIATANFTDAAGGEFFVSFRLVNNYGPPVSRYRLTIVTIKLRNASDTAVDYYFKGLVQTLLPAVPMSSSGLLSGLVTQRPKDSLFAILIQKQVAKIPEVMLAASFSAEADWLQTLPECKTVSSGSGGVSDLAL